MIPKDANIPEFAQILSSQAKEAFENDIPENVKDFVTKTICEFINISGKALDDDEKSDYGMQQTEIICQLVGEWTFHKGVDNYKNEIPEEYWKPILQQIAFAVYETSRRDILNFSDLDAIINNVEYAVNSVYKNCIEQLDKNGQLKKSKEEILKQSNLNDFVKNPPQKKFKKF